MIDKAVIIAGGLGTRICRVMGCSCKQVIRIVGLELFMYPIISLYRAGVREFYVVGNPINYHMLDNILKQYSSILDFKYFLDINPYLNTENGNTALIGLKRYKEPVFLSVSDHIYQPNLPDALRKSNVDEADVVIAGDEKPVLVNFEEATKIYAVDNIVVRIGKDVVEGNYIDSGVFIVNNPVKLTSLFDAEKPSSLAEIFSDHRVKTHVYGFKNIIWKDIDDMEDLKYIYNSPLRDIVLDTINFVNRKLHNDYLAR